MIKLIASKTPNDNAIEVNWIDETVIPAVGTEGDEGYQPEQTTSNQVASVTYHATQRGLFIADCAKYGGNPADHDALWNQVEAAHVPPAPPTAEETNAEIDAQIALIERREGYPRGLREFMLEQPGSSAKPWFVKVKAVDDEVAALRVQRQ